VEFFNFLRVIAHNGAQLTQSQYFTDIYCLVTLIVFIFLLFRMVREKKCITQACNDATRNVKFESQDENMPPAAGLESHYENEFPNAEKRRKELLFKYNFSSINDALCQNAIFKHHWSP